MKWVIQNKKYVLINTIHIPLFVHAYFPLFVQNYIDINNFPTIQDEIVDLLNNIKN